MSRWMRYSNPAIISNIRIRKWNAWNDKASFDRQAGLTDDHVTVALTAWMSSQAMQIEVIPTSPPPGTHARIHFTGRNRWRSGCWRRQPRAQLRPYCSGCHVNFSHKRSDRCSWYGPGRRHLCSGRTARPASCLVCCASFVRRTQSFWRPVPLLPWLSCLHGGNAVICGRGLRAWAPRANQQFVLAWPHNPSEQSEGRNHLHQRLCGLLARLFFRAFRVDATLRGLHHRGRLERIGRRSSLFLAASAYLPELQDIGRSNSRYGFGRSGVEARHLGTQRVSNKVWLIPLFMTGLSITRWDFAGRGEVPIRRLHIPRRSK